MCEGCWEEAGCPKIVNDKTRKAAELVSRLYEFSCVGGNLHIVTDDWNLEDDHVKACAETVAGPPGEFRDDNPDQLAIEGELCQLLMGMTEAERASALALEAGYFELVN